MMILKTNRLNSFFLITTLFVSKVAGAEGFNTFECLRDLLPATDRGSYQSDRNQVERPFVINNKYIVFPEIKGRGLTGFFLYDRLGAYYYDSIEAKGAAGNKITPIAELSAAKDKTLYQMVVQPGGLETVTIYYMPGFDSKETNASGPVVLGTSVLPVIGAFVSRPDQYDSVYQNPSAVPDGRLKEFISAGQSRRPASASKEAPALKIDRKIVSLGSRKIKDNARLWQPLKDELALRRDWIKKTNLDAKTSRDIARPLNGPCKQ